MPSRLDISLGTLNCSLASLDKFLKFTKLYMSESRILKHILNVNCVHANLSIYTSSRLYDKPTVPY